MNNGSRKPVLWHIPVSHYNEKVRWALALKGVEHVRRAPPPPAHMAVALALTRGREKTFPVLTLDGRHIADSTAIIAALEERYPDPPLYPADPAERARALELEDFFDEELAPAIRQLAWHELTRDPERFHSFAAETLGGPLARFQGVVGRGAALFLRLRFRSHDDELATQSRAKIATAMDRLEAELDGGEYLVGDSFTVADLTAASLFYPLVLPPEAPRQLNDPTPAWNAIREPYMGRPGYRWVEQTF